MNKEDVQLIVLKASSNAQEAISMKIYKNGTICRSGVGATPPVGIGLMTFVNDSRYFDLLISKIPQEILDVPINHEETEIANGDLEYVLAFFGSSKNGETGENAEWSKSTGIRIKLDQHSQFNHPILGLLDTIITDAAELTNELYFDALMLAKWNAKSSKLPDKTLISQPKSEIEISKDFENYVNQVLNSSRQWDMRSWIKNKTYEIQGTPSRAYISLDEHKFHIQFEPAIADSPISTAEKNQTLETNNKTKKPWWKFWNYNNN